MSFLHVPTFLADYGNPQTEASPASRPSSLRSATCPPGTSMTRACVRTPPTASPPACIGLSSSRSCACCPQRPAHAVHHPGVFVAATMYAIGLGKLSRALALLAEAISHSVNAGPHRSAEVYDCFEDEVSKRSFWCVYLWDKQAAPLWFRLRTATCPSPRRSTTSTASPRAWAREPPRRVRRDRAALCRARERDRHPAELLDAGRRRKLVPCARWTC